MITGRFAPSPTGPLHLGSLVAAVGSFLFARAAGGRWLVRIEDIDTPRVVRGSEKEILGALRRYGLDWDGDIVRQSERTDLYRDALAKLRDFTFDCGCSRADDECRCRHGLSRAPRAVRFRGRGELIAFDDMLAGRVEGAVDDFVVKRADGPYAYQLAVVVDDAEQGVNQVVRGADLLDSTPRQIALQRALDLPRPVYAHVPVVFGPDGRKIGKRDGALPLPTLDPARIRDTLGSALRFLGFHVEAASPAEMLDQAIRLTRERRYATIEQQRNQI